MEIALLILVVALTGVVGYLFFQMQLLKVHKITDTEWHDIMSAVDKKVNRLEKSKNGKITEILTNVEKKTLEELESIGKKVDSNENRMRAFIREYVKEELDRTTSTKQDDTDIKKYVDERIKSLNNKFFKVINLDK